MGLGDEDPLPEPPGLNWRVLNALSRQKPPISRNELLSLFRPEERIQVIAYLRNLEQRHLLNRDDDLLDYDVTQLQGLTEELES